MNKIISVIAFCLLAFQLSAQGAQRAAALGLKRLIDGNGIDRLFHITPQ